MGAFESGFERFANERAAEHAAAEAEQAGKQKQASALYELLQANGEFLAARDLMPQVTGVALLIRRYDQDYASISPAADGELFELTVGGKGKTVSGDAQKCLNELGFLIAEDLDERDNRARQERVNAARRPLLLEAVGLKVRTEVKCSKSRTSSCRSRTTASSTA